MIYYMYYVIYDDIKICILDTLVRQMITFIKVYVVFFWTSDPLIDKIYKNLSIKGSET